MRHVTSQGMYVFFVSLQEVFQMAIELISYIFKDFMKSSRLEPIDTYLLICYLNHRGLKLDGAIGQGKICNSLKSEKFSKSFLSHIGKNKIKF